VELTRKNFVTFFLVFLREGYHQPTFAFGAGTLTRRVVASAGTFVTSKQVLTRISGLLKRTWFLEKLL